jgi:hypothetical protein
VQLARRTRQQHRVLLQRAPGVEDLPEQREGKRDDASRALGEGCAAKAEQRVALDRPAVWDLRLGQGALGSAPADLDPVLVPVGVALE